MPKRPAAQPSKPASEPRQRTPPDETGLERDADPDGLASPLAAEATDERTYPLFPDVAPGAIASMLVFRLIPSARGKSVDPVQVTFRFDPYITDREFVSQICGGGRFLVQARGHGGAILAGVKFTLDGAARVPGEHAAAAQVGLSAHETAGGWVTVPDAKPEINIALLALQQSSNNARGDSNKALEALGRTNDALTSNLSKILESVAAITAAPRAQDPYLLAQITTLSAENKRLTDELVALKEAKLKLEFAALMKGSPVEHALSNALNGDTMATILSGIAKHVFGGGGSNAAATVTTNAGAALPAAIPATVTP